MSSVEEPPPVLGAMSFSIGDSSASLEIAFFYGREGNNQVMC